MRSTTNQVTFTAGELSPRLLAREDQTKYRSGAKTLENFKIVPYGPVVKRTGTKFHVETKDSTKKSRLIPFIFNESQAYILEFGEYYIRFNTNEAVVAEGNRFADPSFATGINLFTEYYHNSGTHEWDDTWKQLALTNGTGAGHYSRVVHQVSVPLVACKFLFDAVGYTAASTMTVKIGPTRDSSTYATWSGAAGVGKTLNFTPTSSDVFITIIFAYASGAETANIDNIDVQSQSQTMLELSTPYNESQIADLKFSQSADALFIVHPSHPPYELLRYGTTAWLFKEVDWVDGPYLGGNTDTANTITPSAVSGLSVTLTAIKPTFKADVHIGALWRLDHAGTTGYLKITSVTNAKVAIGETLKDFGAATATAVWAEGAWSNSEGFPSAIGFYDQRLFMANTANQPQTIWGSQVGVFRDMTDGTADSDAVTYTIAARRLNPIQWLSPARFMLIGTSGEEYRAGDDAAPITPSNINIKLQTGHGSTSVQPEQIDNATLFAQRAGKKIREMLYSYDDEAYIAPDVTLLSEHITKSGIKEMAYQQEPDSILWAVRTDGEVCALTYQRPQEVLGWHRHKTDGTFESIESIPMSDHDQVWFIVNRTINGATKRYIEFMEEDFPVDGLQADMYFVDCGITYSGASATVISGLTHLEGKTVAILGDGAIQPSKVVTGGQVTLDTAVTKAQIGLPYTALLETLPAALTTEAGTIQGEQKRKGKSRIYIYRTIGLKIGDSDSVEEVDVRGDGDAMDSPPPFKTGFVEVSVLGWDDEASIKIQHDYPTACTILSEVAKLEANHD